MFSLHSFPALRLPGGETRIEGEGRRETEGGGRTGSMKGMLVALERQIGP